MTPIDSRDGFINQYIGVCVGAPLYGVFVVTIRGSMRLFRRQGRGKWWTHVISVLLFVMVTLHIVLLNARLGMTVVRCHMCGLDLGARCDPIPWFERAQTFIVAFCTLLTESAMIYRCWLIRERETSVIIIPSLLWFYGLAVMICTTILDNHSKRHSGRNSGTAHVMQVCFWILTIFMKGFTTALIVYKLWHKAHEPLDITHIDEAGRETRATQLYNSVIYAFMESGSICVVASVFVCVSLFYRMASVLAPTMMIMVSGISFNLIPIRVEQSTQRKDAGRVVSTLCFSQSERTLVSSPRKAYLRPESQQSLLEKGH